MKSATKFPSSTLYYCSVIVAVAAVIVLSDTRTTHPDILRELNLYICGRCQTRNVRDSRLWCLQTKAKDDVMMHDVDVVDHHHPEVPGVLHTLPSS
jgi:hypothetical protein